VSSIDALVPLPEDEPEDLTSEKYDWLPEKFKDPEALVESYKNAERKIHEQSQQLREMSETLGAYEEELAQAATHAPVETMQHLTQEVQAPQYQPQAELVAVDQALAIATSQLGAEQVGKAVDLFKSNPEWSNYLITQAMQAGAAGITHAISEAVHAMNTIPTQGELRRSSDSARSLKIAAQGLSGGQSGRSEHDPESAEQAWERIRAAGQNSYSGLMTRGG
jgi:hypothetical protein